MKIVQGDELEWVRGLEYRGGTFHFRNLMEGTPGTIDNFQLSMGRNDKDFVSPRHRHNFEQFRFQLEGDLNFARDGVMTPGMVGYLPGGHVLRPADQRGDRDDLRAAIRRLERPGLSVAQRGQSRAWTRCAQTGTFDGGVYRRNDGEPGKRNMDGFQAIWEQANGRAAAISQAALCEAGDDGPGELRMGRRCRISPACAKNCSACSPSGARKPAFSSSTPGATLTGIGARPLSRLCAAADGRRPAAAAADHGVPGAWRTGVVRRRAGDRVAALRPARSARA